MTCLSENLKMNEMIVLRLFALVNSLIYTKLLREDFVVHLNLGNNFNKTDCFEFMPCKSLTRKGNAEEVTCSYIDKNRHIERAEPQFIQSMPEFGVQNYFGFLT